MGDSVVKVDKPWGYEEIYPVGKLLFIKKGKRLSLQYHRVKWERMYLWEGDVVVTVAKDKKRLNTRSSAVEITPGTVHRVEALEDSIIIELSTGELNDVVRIEDDYDRE